MYSPHMLDVIKQIKFSYQFRYRDLLKTEKDVLTPDLTQANWAVVLILSFKNLELERQVTE